MRMRTGAELARLIDKTRLPFVLKGIMTVRGALAALEAGAYGIVVSNHGGRVLDDTPATVDVLPEIVQAVGGRMKIFVDGGIRTGLDVFKVLALGADAALIGRPYPMLAHGGGQEAVELYSRRIGDELRDAMLMAGARPSPRSARIWSGGWRINPIKYKSQAGLPGFFVMIRSKQSGQDHTAE